MGTNGYFSFMRSVTYCCPHAFPYSTYNYLVAPFWADIDTRIQGTVSYEVHNDGSSLLAQVNTYLTSYTGSVFSGNWMIAAEWQGVQQHSRTGPTQPVRKYFLPTGSGFFSNRRGFYQKCMSRRRRLMHSCFIEGTWFPK